MTEGPAESPSPAAASVPRLTPYELVFGEAGFEHRIFPSIEEEADSQGEDPARLERFAFLTRVSDSVRDVLAPDAPAEALEQYRVLVYHGFNFWRYGRRLYLMEPAVARYLVEGSPSLADWDLRLPHPSVYVQLPPNLFWASISPEMPPEPVDGFYAAECRGFDPLGPGVRRLHLLMVLGIRRERAGFSVIPFDTEVGPGIAHDWTDTPGREEGRDFDNVLPGGEIAGLYSILTTAEALKLIARALWYMDDRPEDVVPEGAPERRTRDRPGSVALSRLAFHRVRLAGGAEPAAPGEDAAAEA